jgi:putative flavoprotein involved in K+ transport
MSNDGIATERLDVVVIGGGQAGLAVGYHLKRLDLSFVILDANHRIGDSWRHRWDSLRLFTPARYDSLDGMPFPAPPHYFPTKDEMADYLERYATHFDLPVRNGVTVTRLSGGHGKFLVETNDGDLEAGSVVVAMSSWQNGKVPSFAADIAQDVVQLHSSEYESPAQLRPGSILVVGAGNSGADIAMDVADGRRTVSLSGPDVGHIPFRPEGWLGRLLIPIIFRVVFHRILTTSTPIGRRLRLKLITKGEPLVRVKPKDLERAGVERVARVVGAESGTPLLQDGTRLEVANVVWCTGYSPAFDWIDLPLDSEDPAQLGGISPDHPGLYFVGLKFLYSISSHQIHGVNRDAARVADAIGARSASATVDV